jgi:hypothetical protein
MAKKSTDRKSSRPGEEDMLESFLGSFENFVSQIGAEAIHAAAKGEQRVLIEATGDSLVGQTNKLTAFVRETAGRLSPVQRGELNRFLRVQDGVAFATRGVAVSRQVLRSGVLGSVLHWISQHLKELKKILSEILHFIFDLLHISYPDWLDKLLQILDEFLDLLLSLLGDVFGIDIGRTARQLSEQEVDFLHEWAAFEAVRVVRAGRRPANQDETK